MKPLAKALYFQVLIAITLGAPLGAVYRLMSEARALTQVIGNGVATLVIAKWTGELDAVRMHRELERSEGNMRNIDERE